MGMLDDHRPRRDPLLRARTLPRLRRPRPRQHRGRAKAHRIARSTRTQNRARAAVHRADLGPGQLPLRQSPRPSRPDLLRTALGDPRPPSHMTTRPVGAGDPGPQDLAAFEQLERNDETRLELVRSRAEKWTG